MFGVYDVDGDGSVGRADLLTVLRSLAGSSLTDAELDAIVEQALKELPPARRAAGLDFEAFCQVFGEESCALSVRIPHPVD